MTRDWGAGRRGRPRSAYEAPPAPADRGTPLGGAESKRRGCPRLPAPPSRVTLLVQLVLAPPVHVVAERRLLRLVEQVGPEDEVVHLRPPEAAAGVPRRAHDRLAA